MRSAADVREEILGKLEVELQVALADEQAAAQKQMTLIGLDANLGDDDQLNQIDQVVTRRREHVIRARAYREMMAMVTKIRIV